MFGKKVLGSDTKFMIKFYDWQKDAVYVQYDDQEDMDGKRFYAIVSPNNNDTGDYRVFKCLSNNNGSASTAPPNWNPENISQVYRTADGYVWKFFPHLQHDVVYIGCIVGCRIEITMYHWIGHCDIHLHLKE